jgi:hypothetical protein
MQYYTYIILVATLVRGCWPLLQAKFLCSWGVPFLRLVHPPCLTPDIKPPPPPSGVLWEKSVEDMEYLVESSQRHCPGNGSAPCTQRATHVWDTGSGLVSQPRENFAQTDAEEASD